MYSILSVHALRLPAESVMRPVSVRSLPVTSREVSLRPDLSRLVTMLVLHGRVVVGSSVFVMLLAPIRCFENPPTFAFECVAVLP